MKDPITKGAIEGWLSEWLVRELGIERSRVDVRRPMAGYGLDSVDAVTLAVDLEKWLGFKLEARMAYDYGSVSDLAAAIHSLLQVQVQPTASICGRGLVPHYPLSHQQRAFWFLHQLAPESDAYNVALAIRIVSSLNIGRLRAALVTLAQRHRALRVNFDLNSENTPRQHVGSGPGFVMETIQASNWDDERLEREVKLSYSQPFDLEHDPLVRVHLFTRAQQDNVLLLTSPHIVVDFWSLLLMLRDLGSIYAEEQELQVAPAIPILEYSDWVSWQDEILKRECERLATYWVDQLRDSSVAIDLPTDRPRHPAQTNRGASYTFELDPQLTEALRNLAKTHNTTLYVVLLAAFQLLLHRYSGQSDLSVGSPVSGRTQPEVENVVGCFINMIVLRSKLAERASVRDFLYQVRGTVLDALAHQDFPYPLLVEQLNPPRAGKRPPVFQTMFALQTMHRFGELARLFVRSSQPETVKVGGLKCERIDLAQQEGQFELSLEMAELDGKLFSVFKYNAELFDTSTIERMSGHFERLLDAFVEDIDQPASAVRILTSDEWRTISEWSGSDSHPAATGCIHSLFEAQAKRTPEVVALVSSGRELTYRELDRRATAMALHLCNLGVGAETLVGVCLDRSPELVVTLLAILKAGGAYVPLDPKYPAARLQFMLADAGARLVITETRYSRLFSTTGIETICLGPELSHDEREGCSNVTSVSDRKLAYVLYTSGSTGRPKGVAIEHRNAVTFLAWAIKFFGDDLSGVLASTSVCFDLSVFEIFAPLSCGGKIVLVNDALALHELQPAQGVVLVNTVPSVMAEVLRTGALSASVRTVCLAGEPVPRALVEQLYERSHVGRVLNLYGPTEATTYSTFAVLDRNEAAVPSIGRPIAGTTVHVLDPELNPVPVGFIGALYLGGHGITRGYLGQPALTSTRFIPNRFSDRTSGRLYQTGDLVRWRADGTLEFVGRDDNQVKVRGFRIELEEIQLVLQQHRGVDRAVVIRAADRKGQLEIVAYVVPASAEHPSSSGLRAFLATRLPEYMLPAAFVFVDKIPSTPNGKLDSRALPPWGGAYFRVPFIRPETEDEQSLAALWTEVLKVNEIGLHENFFQLGGHSLLAARLVSGIREKLGVAVPLSEFYDTPTLKKLAEFVNRARTSRNGNGHKEVQQPAVIPAPIARHRPFPLTEIQRAYWIGRNKSLELGGVSSHVYLEFDSPYLDLRRVEAGIKRLVERHDMLRAIVERNGKQRVLAHVSPYKLKVLELQAESGATLEQKLVAVRSEMSHQVMVCDQWPLFDIRATLLPDRFRLHVSLDALIADAWSLICLARDFSVFYADPDAELPPLDLTFRDYMFAEAALRKGPLGAASKEYWSNRLPQLPPAPELPLLQQARSPGRPEFVRLSANLHRDVWAGFKERAAEAGVTPSAALLTAYGDVLARWNKDPEFTVSVTIFNRHALHPDVDKIVGDFTSLLPFAIDARIGTSFEFRARRQNAQLGENLEHRHVSGVELLRDLAKIQKRNINGLIPVVFTSILPLQAGPSETDQINWPGQPVYGISQTPQVCLDHQVTESHGALAITWDFVESLFPPGLVERMFSAYCNFLEQLADTAWRSVGQPTLVNEDLEVTSDFNQTDRPANQATLISLFETQVLQRPNHEAVIAVDKTLTYQELNRKADRLAARLRELRVRPNSLVGVAMLKGWKQVVATLAVMKAGAAYLPLNIGLPQKRLNELCVIGEVELVLCESDGPALSWPDGIKCVAVEGAVRQEDADNCRLGPAPDDLAYVIFTSGSTGNPKGVMISHRAAVNTILAINEELHVTESDRVLALSCLDFDLSVYDLFGTLGAGGTIIMPESRQNPDPAYWNRLLSEHRVTLWNSVPGLMEMLVTYLDGIGGELDASLRLVLLSGDWIPLTLPDRIWHLAPAAEIVSLGGATESSIWSIFFPIKKVEPEWKSIPYGRPLPNQRLYVLDQALAPRPLEVPGDLFIAGAGLATGYWRDSAQTDRSFFKHPLTGERLYRTGDLCQYRPDGTIEFLGRNDLQVKIRGYRIEIGEIEASLLAHPDVRLAAVVAAERPSRKRLIAYVIFNAQTGVSSSGLRAFLAESLPAHMIPAVIKIVDELPLSANGKVDRKAIRAASETEPEIRSGFAETDMERLVAAIWQVVLGTDRFGIDDNFFEVGGDSMLVAQVQAELCAELSREISILDLFENPTVRSLSAKLVAPNSNPFLNDAISRGLHRSRRRDRRRQSLAYGR
jgi:amino acid adenylation domain-containing protein